MLQDHEGDGVGTAIMDDALARSCILSGDALTRLVVILGGLELDTSRMARNLELTRGLIGPEAVMLALGRIIGRQHAHDVVSEATVAVRGDGSRFAVALPPTRASPPTWTPRRSLRSWTHRNTQVEAAGSPTTAPHSPGRWRHDSVVDERPAQVGEGRPSRATAEPAARRPAARPHSRCRTCQCSLRARVVEQAATLTPMPAPMMSSSARSANV